MAELRELAGRYPQARSALLPMLHLVQSSEGYVSPAGIEACAEILGQTAAEVSAVATFYTMFKRRPVGDYLVGVCTNTLCAVMGGDADLRAAEEPPRRRQRRDDGRRQGHPRAHRVQRRLRLRAGRDGQLGVLRQPDAAVRDRPGRRPAQRRGGDRHRAARGCAPGARPSGCSPGSPTAVPTRARSAARPRWSASSWPASNGWTAPESEAGRERSSGRAQGQGGCDAGGRARPTRSAPSRRRSSTRPLPPATDPPARRRPPSAQGKERPPR